MNATLEYTKNAVMTASQAKLIVMMYDGAIRFAEQARYHLGKNEVAACGTAISRAYNVISELKVSLDPNVGGEDGTRIVEGLEQVYTFAMDSLVRANVERDVKHLDGVLRVLRILKEGWDGIVDQV